MVVWLFLFWLRHSFSSHNHVQLKCLILVSICTIISSYLDPSLIESASGSQVVLEGNNLTLHCNASGNPTANITWTKDYSSSVLNQGITYSIVNIGRNASGNYTCAAWNGIGGQKKAIAAITVHCEFSRCISNHYSCEKKYFTELLSTRRLTIQLNSVLSRSKCYNLQASFYEHW